MTHSQVVALGELMAPRSGSIDPAQYPDEQFALYSIPAYDSGKPQVCQGIEIGSAKQIVCPEDVLLSRIVPHIRRAWIVDGLNKRRLIASGEWIIFRNRRVHPPYLRQLLMGDKFHQQFMTTVAGVGGSLLRARPSGVARIQVSLPELSEQRRIAAILDQADALRAKRRASLRKLDDLRKSLFLDIFGDPATNPKQWPKTLLGQMLESATYGTSKKAGTTGTYPILRMSNLTFSGRMDLKDLKYIDLTAQEARKCIVSDGEILFNRTNSADLVGKTAVFRGTRPMAFAGYLIRLRPNELADSEYIAGVLNSSYGKSKLRGMCKSIIGMANINAKEVQTIELPRPPISLQRRYAENVMAIEQLRDRQLASLTKLDALFASLQHRAFRGEL
jgi:type I restriction enzyme S subunit